MSGPSTSASRGGGDEPQPASEKSVLLNAAAKFADAATVLGLISTALYFWGYIYHGQFCERLGVSFQGISLPTEDYLIVNWLTVVMLLTFIAAGLVLVFLIRDSADIAGRLLAKFRTQVVAPKKPSPALPFLKLGFGVFVLTGVLLVGAKFMIIQANEAADKTLARRTPIVVRDGEGKVIEGRFIYLRDFGSALLVAELGADGRQIVAHRVLKAASYSGYSLMTPAPAAP